MSPVKAVAVANIKWRGVMHMYLIRGLSIPKSNGKCIPRFHTMLRGQSFVLVHSATVFIF